jgi:hypothetical protein
MAERRHFDGQDGMVGDAEVANNGDVTFRHGGVVGLGNISVGGRVIEGDKGSSPDVEPSPAPDLPGDHLKGLLDNVRERLALEVDAVDEPAAPGLPKDVFGDLPQPKRIVSDLAERLRKGFDI